ncbi:MAG TPA: hypothetical protein RMH99_22720 [Sandaracinaceae bacterium LLY-WYZ-13_1]|nr:hypothetical protein [Sandaracinaceae bacterium LLY-WYZ-13_1]
MTEGEEEASALVGLLWARSPVRGAVVRGREMEVVLGDPALLDGALGEGAARARIEERLGPDWVDAVDRVRTRREPYRTTCLVDERLWDLWLEPLPAERVAVYGRPVDREAPLRDHLHAIRNALYGIRAAVKVLLARELDPELRAVLERVVGAAEEGEDRVAAVERCR